MTTSSSALSPELLDILRCPENRGRLKPADAPLVQRLNQAARAGMLRNVAGEAVTEKMQAGLLRDDGQIVYPVVQGIPKLLVEEGIRLDQFGP